jgi:hypothetical protein
MILDTSGGISVDDGGMNWESIEEFYLAFQGWSLPGRSKGGNVV